MVDLAEMGQLGVGDAVLWEGRWRTVTDVPAAEFVVLDGDEWVHEAPWPASGTVLRVPAPVLEALRGGVRDPYRG